MKILNNFWFGLVLGLVTSFIAVLLYYLFKYSDYQFGFYLKFWLIQNKQTFIPVFISAAGNLAWFYYFLNREKYSTTKGLVVSIVLDILAIVIIKFII